MSIRSALFAVGILAAGAVLILVGGFGAILLLTGRQCGTSGYLCEPPRPTSEIKETTSSTCAAGPARAPLAKEQHSHAKF
jgi:hypothetical protein